MSEPRSSETSPAVKQVADDRDSNIIQQIAMEDVAAPENHEKFTKIEVGIASDIGARDLNEDQAAYDHKIPLALVADGMGGCQAGEVASKLAVDTCQAYFYPDEDTKIMYTDVARQLQAAVAEANYEVWSQASAENEGMGTTLVAALVREERLIVANVGDSRAYLIRNGTIRQLTRDHSWVDEQVLAGRLTAEQAKTHPYRSVITRSIGYRDQVEVDIFEELIQPGDQVLLCSDGLTKELSDQEILDVVLKSASSQHAADALCAAAAAKNNRDQDNTTVLLIKLA